VSATGLHACAVSAVRLALLVVRARDECVYVYCMQVCPGKCHRQQDGSCLMRQPAGLDQVQQLTVCVMWKLTVCVMWQLTVCVMWQLTVCVMGPRRP
jgi:hypothetical protein